MSHSSCGSDIQDQPSWVVLLRFCISSWPTCGPELQPSEGPSGLEDAFVRCLLHMTVVWNQKYNYKVRKRFSSSHFYYIIIYLKKYTSEEAFSIGISELKTPLVYRYCLCCSYTHRLRNKYQSCMSFPFLSFILNIVLYALVFKNTFLCCSGNTYSFPYRLDAR